MTAAERRAAGKRIDPGDGVFVPPVGVLGDLEIVVQSIEARGRSTAKEP